jgi:hypothetical protein
LVMTIDDTQEQEVHLYTCSAAVQQCVIQAAILVAVVT